MEILYLRPVEGPISNNEDIEILPPPLQNRIFVGQGRPRGQHFYFLYF